MPLLHYHIYIWGVFQDFLMSFSLLQIQLHLLVKLESGFCDILQFYIYLRRRTKKTKIAPVLFFILKCFKVSKFGGILTKSFTALKLVTRPRVLNFVVKLFIVFLYLMADSRQAERQEHHQHQFFTATNQCNASGKKIKNNHLKID